MIRTGSPQAAARLRQQWPVVKTDGSLSSAGRICRWSRDGNEDEVKQRERRGRKEEGRRNEREADKEKTSSRQRQTDKEKEEKEQVRKWKEFLMMRKQRKTRNKKERRSQALELIVLTD